MSFGNWMELIVSTCLNGAGGPVARAAPTWVSRMAALPVYRQMRAANPAARLWMRGKVACMQEYWADPDGRVYVMEYRSTGNGRHAAAWCRVNPWGASPNAGADYYESHVRGDGLVCLGQGNTSGWTHESPYSFEQALLRGRFWCTAFSVYKESGVFPHV